MKAIEFVTKIKNGTIEVPEKYLDNLKKECRVIILVNEEVGEEQQKTKKIHLTALKLKTKGLKFNREEANER